MRGGSEPTQSLRYVFPDSSARRVGFQAELPDGALAGAAASDAEDEPLSEAFSPLLPLSEDGVLSEDAAELSEDAGLSEFSGGRLGRP